MHAIRNGRHLAIFTLFVSLLIVVVVTADAVWSHYWFTQINNRIVETHVDVLAHSKVASGAITQIAVMEARMARIEMETKGIKEKMQENNDRTQRMLYKLESQHGGVR